MIYSVQPHVLQLQHTFTGHIPDSKSSLSSQLLGRHRSRLESKGTSFFDIVDCCPMKSGDIVVLDKSRILVLSPDGHLLRATSDPVLKTTPTGHVKTLAVDFRSGAIVCCPETRRLLQFDPTVPQCPLRRVLLDTNYVGEDAIALSDSSTDHVTEIPTCIAVDAIYRRLFVAVLIGDTRAEVKVEVKIYQLWNCCLLAKVAMLICVSNRTFHCRQAIIQFIQSAMNVVEFSLTIKFQANLAYWSGIRLANNILMRFIGRIAASTRCFPIKSKLLNVQPFLSQ